MLGASDAPARALTARLTERFGSPDVTLTDSGTSALRLAIEEASARAPGRPIALPAWACFDVLSAALGAGTPFRFYDLDADSLGPERSSLGSVAAECAAIVVVHAFGAPVDIAAVRAIVGSQVAIIEDAAQAWGASIGGARAASVGDLGVISFSRGKGITGGGGGALVRRAARQGLHRGADVPAAARGTRQLVGSVAQYLLSPPSLYAIPASIPWLGLGVTHFREPHAVGPIARASAAMVLASIDAADRSAAFRRARGERLRAVVSEVPRLRNVRLADGATPSWLRLPVLASDRATRDALVARGRALGLAFSYPRPLDDLAREHGWDAKGAHAPTGARTIADRLLTLPTHEMSSPRDLRALEALLRA